MTNNNKLRVQRLNLSPLRITQYDIQKQSIIEQPVSAMVTYRNTLLQALHPDAAFMLFNCKGYAVTGGFDMDGIAAALEHSYEVDDVIYKFDFATGSRKHGLFLASDLGTVASRYFKADYRRVSHGSILSTNCHGGMFKLSNARVLILDDEDVRNQYAFGIGDCFGLVSRSIAKHFNGQTQVQFRAGVRDQWIAKGCLLPTASDNLLGADIVLPASSFKGHMPTVGKVYQYSELFFGIHLDATARIGQASHTGLVWFTSEESKQHLTNLTRDAINELNDARLDLHRILPLVYNPDQVCLDGNEDEDDDDTYNYQYLESILTNAAQPEQLLHHPAVTNWLNNKLSARYTKLALTGGMTGDYLMAAPMVNLPRGIVISWSMPSGPRIMQRYPIRGRVDIKQVMVINPTDLYSDDSVLSLYSDEQLDEWRTILDTWFENPCTVAGIDYQRDYTGNFFINPDFFAEVGGDFDGDCALFIDANQHAPLYNEIATWILPPNPEKPPKTQIKGSVYEIAAKSTSNAVGLVTWLNMKRWALGIHTARVGLDEINCDIWFADQLQKAVDGYKTSVEVDYEALTYIGKFISKTAGDAIFWMDDYKQRSAQRKRNTLLFRDRTCSIDHPGLDPVGAMMTLARDLWSPSIWKPAPTENFRYLFNWVKPSQSALDDAQQWLYSYKRTVATIFEDMETASEQHAKLLIGSYHAYLVNERNAFLSLKGRDGSLLTPSQRLEVAAARWYVAHSRTAQGTKNARQLQVENKMLFYICKDEVTLALNEIRAQFFKGFIPKSKAAQSHIPSGKFIGTIRMSVEDSLAFDLYNNDQWVMAINANHAAVDAAYPWMNAQLPIEIKQQGKAYLCCVAS